MKKILMGLVLVGSLTSVAMDLQDWQGSECKNANGVVPNCTKLYFCDAMMSPDFPAVELWNTNGQFTVNKFIYHNGGRTSELVGSVNVACYTTQSGIFCSVGQVYDGSKEVFEANNYDSTAMFTELDATGNPVQSHLQCY